MQSKSKVLLDEWTFATTADGGIELMECLCCTGRFGRSVDVASRRPGSLPRAGTGPQCRWMRSAWISRHVHPRWSLHRLDLVQVAVEYSAHPISADRSVPDVRFLVCCINLIVFKCFVIFAFPSLWPLIHFWKNSTTECLLVDQIAGGAEIITGQQTSNRPVIFIVWVYQGPLQLLFSSGEVCNRDKNKWAWPGASSSHVVTSSKQKGQPKWNASQNDVATEML